MKQLAPRSQSLLVKHLATRGQLRSNHLWLLGIIAILAGYLAHTWSFYQYINDDAYITFRYSRSLAEGLGPFFNLHEAVEGYTSFSMMMIVAGAIGAFGEQAAAPAAKTIGILFGALSVVIAFFFTRYLAGLKRSTSSANWWGFIAASLVALNPCFALNSTSGLETTLFAFLLTAAVILATIETTRHRWLGSGLLFAATCLTRPEGIFLWGIFVAMQLVMWSIPAQNQTSSFRRRQIPRLILSNGFITLSFIIAHLVWRLNVYDGEWLPNTYYAKLGGFLHEGTWSYISEGLLPAVLGPIGLIIAMVGLGLKPRILRSAAPVIAVTTAGCLLPLITGKDWMPGFRLLMPYLPLVACLVAVGWGSLFERLGQTGLRFQPAVVLCVVITIWAWHSHLREKHHEYVDIRSNGYQTGHIALAKWLNNDTHDPARPIALMDIGLIGYHCPERDIIDITGLTNRFIAKSEGGFLDKKYDPNYILNQQPEYIILTLTAPGDSNRPPSPQAPLSFWTPIERRIFSSPIFQRSYVDHAPLDEPFDDNLHRLAHRIGAERVFEHSYPDAHYLLAVFRNQQVTDDVVEHHASMTPTAGHVD